MIRSIIAASLPCLFFFAQLKAQPGPQPPFTIELEAVATAQPLPGLHSFAFAQDGSRWLFAGGRINGLHGFSTNDNFPVQFANDNLIVIDTANWQVYQSSVYPLGLQMADPLRSTNMQYVQRGDYLYMTGGFGWDSTANGYRTFPTLTAIRVDSVIDAVINNTPLAPHIRQLTDTNLRVCGGEMAMLGNEFYLCFGHNFSGRYSDPPVPTFTQRYTEQIRRFEIIDNGTSLQIANYTAFTDTAHFHRRDLNLGHIIRPNGSEALMAYSGVFQKNADLPWPSPILITGSGGVLQAGFTQLLNNYTCGMVPVFDSLLGDMYTVFLGGMGWYTYDANTNNWVYDSLVPFVSDIGLITQYANGQFAQSVLPTRMNGLQGSNAKFIAAAPAMQYANDVINLRRLQGRVLAGYLYGGIQSQLPNLSPVTVAVDTVYRVWITPDQLILPVTEANTGIAFMRIFPNPAGTQACVRIKTAQNELLRISLLDVQGRVIQQHQLPAAAGLQQDFWLNTSALANGLYSVKVETATGVQVLRLAVQE
ncbi:MAG: T9SS type A sorting domain-containing protein [Bacteroidia bacterium]|jgi:hypothetical protein|nr:T9SS type A sorting domain-containing protein [Bacteroidia bacterium]